MFPPRKVSEERPGAEVKSQVQGLVVPALVWDLYWCTRGSYWEWKCEKESGQDSWCLSESLQSPPIIIKGFFFRSIDFIQRNEPNKDALLVYIPVPAS